MSKAYKCDRCGGYFEPGDQGEIKNNVYDVIVGNEIKDLCPKCRDDLYHWYMLNREGLGREGGGGENNA